MSLLLCVTLASSLFAQHNKDALIKEAEEMLKNNKATISQILTDKNMILFILNLLLEKLLRSIAKRKQFQLQLIQFPGKK